jgi:hypothetical protein
MPSEIWLPLAQFSAIRASLLPFIILILLCRYPLLGALLNQRIIGAEFFGGEIGGRQINAEWNGRQAGAKWTRMRQNWRQKVPNEDILFFSTLRSSFFIL